MDADRQPMPRGRVVWLVLLAAWIAGAFWAFAAMTAARSVIPAPPESWMDPAGDYEVQHQLALVMGWHTSLGFTRGVAVALVVLALWAALLRQPHPRQWATVLVAAIVCVIGLLIFGDLGAPLAEARAYLDPVPAFAAQLLIFAGALLLLVLAVVRIRRAPEPAEPQQDRYRIASYTQFNKPEAALRGGSALAEARARAESVLPVDDPGGD
jgi:uncharacterized membrane protein